MKRLFYIFLILVFFSCKKEEKISLVGDWTLESLINKKDKDNIFLQEEFDNISNFKIINDSLIEFKSGFFDYLYIKNEFKTPSTRALYYLGTQTKYYLKDSLFVFYNKNKNTNDTLKLSKVESDKMIIQLRNGTSLRLVKNKNKYFNDKNFDAVVIDRSPCFGACPFNFTYLDKQGNYYFKNKVFNTVNRDISVKISKDKVDYYFDLLYKIDINKFKNFYQLHATDGQTNTISFFKEGKIVKTITTYLTAPIELRYLINELSYAYQFIPEENEFNSILGDNYNFGFQFKDRKLNLLESESDFLEVSLSRANKVNVSFQPKYEMKSNNYNGEGNLNKVLTDGRYYKFINMDNSSYTIDLGYNFIESNPILTKDRNN